MIESVRIDQAGRADEQACLRIAASLPQFFTADARSHMAEDIQSHKTLVARDGSDILGFITSNSLSCVEHEISWLAVRPDMHRKGIGRKLLASLEAALVAGGGQELTVKTLAESAGYEPYHATRAFYEANGFRLVKVVDPYPGWEAGNPCAIYAKTLEKHPG